MNASEAVSKRIIAICKERNISINKLAELSMLTQSTVQNIASETSNNPKMITIVRICDRLGISLSDFFNDKVFDSIDRED